MFDYGGPDIHKLSLFYAFQAWNASAIRAFAATRARWGQDITWILELFLLPIGLQFSEVISCSCRPMLWAFCWQLQKPFVAGMLWLCANSVTWDTSVRSQISGISGNPSCLLFTSDEWPDFYIFIVVKGLHRLHNHHGSIQNWGS